MKRSKRVRFEEHEPKLLPLVNMFKMYPVDGLDLLRYDYYQTQLTRYWLASMPWRPCANGMPCLLDPTKGCIGTRIIGINRPLREYVTEAEHELQRPLSAEPRECVRCMVAATATRLLPHNSNVICVDPTMTIQQFRINPDEWPADMVIYPENHRGSHNILCAPYLRHNMNQICALDDLVLL